MKEFFTKYIQENKNAISNIYVRSNKDKDFSLEEKLLIELKHFAVSFYYEMNNCLGIKLDISFDNKKPKKISSVKYNDVQYYSGNILFNEAHIKFGKIIQFPVTTSVQYETAFLFSALLFIFTMLNEEYRFPQEYEINTPDDISKLLFGISRSIDIADKKIDDLLKDELLAHNFIFGSEPSQEVIAKYRDLLGIDISDRKNAGVAREIIEEAKKTPFFSHLFEDLKNNHDEIKTFLQIVVFRDVFGNIRLKSPHNSILEFVKEKIAQYLPYTQDGFETIVKKLGKIAIKIKRNDFKPIELKTSKERDIVEHIPLFNINGSKINFKIVDFCLLALALYDSIIPDYNCEQRVEKIMEFLPTQQNGSNTEHVVIQTDYDQLSFYGFILILSSSTDMQCQIINNLMDNAKEFDVQEVKEKIVNGERKIKYEFYNRLKQIASIYILSSLIIENAIKKDILREDVFKATFGTTLYTLQSQHWLSALNSSKLYRNLIEASLSHMLEMNNGKADHQPYYFFLYGSYLKEFGASFITKNDIYDYIKDAAELHRRSWADINKETNLKGLLGDINGAFHNLDRHFIKNKNDIEDLQFRTHSYKYGFSIAGHLLCYALANLINRIISNLENDDDLIKINDDLIKINDDLIKIIENNKTTYYNVAIYADYYTRLYNKHYPKQANDTELYLLCGASRCICSMDKLLENAPYHYENMVYLPYDKLKKYIDWLINEDGSKIKISDLENNVVDYIEWAASNHNSRYFYLICKIISKAYSDSAFKKNHGKTSVVIVENLINGVSKSLETTSISFLPYDYL